VLLTTHYMFEADALCDRIAVIAKGEIVGEGTPRELKTRVADGSVVEIEVYGVPEDGSSGCAASRACAPSRRGRASRRSCSSSRPTRGAELTTVLLGHLDGANVGRVTSREPTLEDAYVALVESA
jgi:ABC-2 type transport system ATP-binding protein